MFDYIKGIVTENTPTYVVVETTGGVGYMLNVSLNTFESLQNCKGGSEATRSRSNTRGRLDSFRIHDLT